MRKLFLVLVMLAAVNVSGQWVKVQSFPDNQVYKVLNYDDNILVGSSRIYKSTDMGQTWTTFYQGAQYGISALSIVDGNVWASNNYQNVYTTNNGLNWTTTNLQKYVYDFASYNGRIFAGTESWRCYYTDNGGINWTQCQDIWEDVMCFNYIFGILLAGTSQGLYYTTNSGANWIMAQPLSLQVHDIAGEEKLFAGTDFSGVWSSENYGTSWTQTSLMNVSVEALEIFGYNVFAGTQSNGFYVSTNYGLNWTQRNEGIGNATINSLAIVGYTIFAATDGMGLWKRPLSEIVNIGSNGTETPLQFSLEQNYPNPFNPTTFIRFQIFGQGSIRTASVKILIYDYLGREVQTFVDETLVQGVYQRTFNGTGFPSGVYFYRLIVNEQSETKRMLLLK